MGVTTAAAKRTGTFAALLLGVLSSQAWAMLPPPPAGNDTEGVEVMEICKSLEQKAKINEIFKEVIDSFANYILEDDIIIDENFIEIMGCADYLSNKAGKGAFGSASFYWPNGIVPYEIDFDLVELTPTIEEAVEMLEMLTNVQMPLRTNEPFFLLFRREQNALVCGSSYVGRKDSFIDVGQPVFISQSAACGLGTVIHEALHALGFIHEHQRSDRDSFVTIDDSCFPASAAGNFIKDTDASTLTKYDYNSVLHYHKTAFGTTSCPTILTTNSSYENVIGDCSSISPCDVAAVNAIYSPAVTGGTFDCDYSCACNIETSLLPSLILQRLEDCDFNTHILSSWLNAPPPPPATLSSFADPGEIDFPLCQDEQELILTVPLAGLTSLPCDLLGSLTCSFDPAAILTDGDVYCPRTCRTCDIPALPFDVDVDSRLAFSFDRTLRVVDVYLSSPVEDVYAIEFTYKCAFPLGNYIVAETIDHQMTNFTVVIVDSEEEISNQVFLFGTQGVPPLAPGIHHLVQLQVSFLDSCDLLVFEDVSINSPSGPLTWCGAGAPSGYELCITPSPPPAPLYDTGDVSLDGEVDIGDIVLINLSVTSPAGFLSSVQMNIADLLEDTVVNYNDTLKLVQTVALSVS